MFNDECGIEQDERQQCGKKTFSDMECQARGCCFQACEGCSADIPWCFLAASKSTVFTWKMHQFQAINVTTIKLAVFAIKWVFVYLPQIGNV